MQMGCIPVFFMTGNERDHMWPAHWARWKDAASVNIDWKAAGGLRSMVTPGSIVPELEPHDDAGVLRAMIDGREKSDNAELKAKWVIDLLRAIPPTRVQAMQRALAEHVHEVTYNVGSRGGLDATGRVFRGLLALGRAREARDAAPANRAAAWLARWAGPGADPARGPNSNEAWLRALELAPRPGGAGAWLHEALLLRIGAGIALRDMM